MNRSRALVSSAVIVILLTAIVFGPLVSSISLATREDPEVVTDGSLTLRAATLPSTATIESGSYGAANTYLTVPPATVKVDAIQGEPKLVYSVEISDPKIKQSTLYFLDEEHEMAFQVAMPSLSLTDTTLNQSEYDANIRLAVRNSSSYRILAQRNVTIEVGA